MGVPKQNYNLKGRLIAPLLNPVPRMPYEDSSLKKQLGLCVKEFFSMFIVVAVVIAIVALALALTMALLKGA